MVHTLPHPPVGRRASAEGRACHVYIAVLLTQQPSLLPGLPQRTATNRGRRSSGGDRPQKSGEASLSRDRGGRPQNNTVSRQRRRQRGAFFRLKTYIVHVVLLRLFIFFSQIRFGEFSQGAAAAPSFLPESSGCLYSSRRTPRRPESTKASSTVSPLVPGSGRPLFLQPGQTSAAWFLFVLGEEGGICSRSGVES